MAWIAVITDASEGELARFEIPQAPESLARDLGLYGRWHHVLDTLETMQRGLVSAIVDALEKEADGEK
jgi:hypothetical protein